MAVAYSPYRQAARFGTWQPQSNSQSQSRPGSRLAAVDLYRADDVFTLTVDLPGVDAGSIDVDVDGNALTIRAQRTAPSVEGAKWLTRERANGAIVRRLSLGDGLDRESISADYANGVLTVTIPVSEKAKPRKVSVSGAPASVASDEQSEASE